VIPPGFVSVHVPILEYHYIRINPNPRDRLGFNLSVTPSSGHPVLDFCYPSGRFNKTVEAAVGAAGYQSATTEQPGTIHSWAGRLAWTRVRVNGGELLSAFTASLGPSDPARLLTDPRLPSPLPTPTPPSAVLPEGGSFP